MVRLNIQASARLHSGTVQRYIARSSGFLALAAPCGYMCALVRAIQVWPCTLTASGDGTTCTQAHLKMWSVNKISEINVMERWGCQCIQYLHCGV